MLDIPVKVSASVKSVEPVTPKKGDVMLYNKKKMAHFN